MALPVESFRTIDSRLRALLGAERNTIVDFLLCLEEFDRARGHEALGYGTLWDYCRRELGLLDCAIFRRIHSMVLLRRYPQIAAFLRDGRLWMTSLVKLEGVITPENIDEILAKASRKSVRDVEILVASFNARAAEKTASIRKLPVKSPAITYPNSIPNPTPVVADEPLPPVPLAEEERKPVVASVPPPGPMGPKPRAKVQPLAEDQFQVTLRVPRSVVEKIEKVKKVLSHKIPNGALEAVFEAALDEVLRREEKRHGPKARKPRRASTAANAKATSSGQSAIPATERVELAPKSGAISAAVAREVFLRDDGKCQWVLANGGKCASEHQLEYDHRISRAAGGGSTPENLCDEFGEEFMSQFTRPSLLSREVSIGARATSSSSRGI